MGEFRIAVRNAVRQQHRSLVALFSIAAGVVALVFAGGFIDWILRELREQTIHSQIGHIQVRPAEPRDGRPVPARLPEASNAKALIAATPHVQSVASRLGLSGLISRNDATLSFIGEGIEPAVDITASADDIVSGRPLDSKQVDEVLVGEGLADNLEIKPGDTVVLLVSLPNGAINASDAVVAGTFKTISKAYDDAAIRVPLALAQRLLRTKGADTWILTLDRTEATEQTVAALTTIPALAGLRITPWTALADFYNKAVVLYANQFGVMIALIGVIIVLSITNTMMMNVTERTWEIGTMMAIGTPRASILRMFILEGIVIGVIGGMIGVALGAFVNFAVSAIGLPMPPAPGMRHGFLAEASFGGGLAVRAFVLAFVTSALASVLPALAASRLVIVDALRVAR